MSYLVLARKYRPQTFDDVVRQEHVTRTLTNAISAGRVAHAILFSGPRGTGKTTLARILAKAMNCEQGPTTSPCNVCRSCTEITGGNAVDVFEIDGASNNGVDHIRDLRENIKYMPAHSRFKIYIIDEVHMLSTPAFNALLKTLEEPPAHVMFLFATTEPHKIPITILSRCQRHDLRRIELKDVVDHMAALCQREAMDIAPESLSLIARESGGSMRDALSLLDQIMSCSEGGISHQQVLDILGVVDRKILHDIAAAILSGDLMAVLEMLDDIHDHGHNIKELYSSLLGYFRDLLVIKLGRKAGKLVDLPAHEISQMAERIQNVPHVYLSQLLDTLYREESNIRFAGQPRLAMEMVFVRLFQIKPALPIETLIEKLDALTKGIVVTTDIPANLIPATVVREPLRTAPEIPVSVPAIHDNAPALIAEPEKVSPASPPEIPLAEVKTPSVQSSPVVPDTEPGILPVIPEPARTVEPDTSPSPESADFQELSEPEDIPAPAFHPSDSPEQVWQKLTGLIAGNSGDLFRSTLERCTLKGMADAVLDIEVNGNGFYRKQLEKRRDIIQKACDGFFGRAVQVNFISGAAIPENNRQQKIEQQNQARHEAMSHPVVGAAMEIFGGNIEEIRVF